MLWDYYTYSKWKTKVYKLNVSKKETKYTNQNGGNWGADFSIPATVSLSEGKLRLTSHIITPKHKEITLIDNLQ